MQTSADRLRRARSAAGFASAAQAATRFKWNPNTYKAHENGIRGMKSRTVERYARAFQVSPAWISYGLGPAPTGLVQNGPIPPPGFAEESADAPRNHGAESVASSGVEGRSGAATPPIGVAEPRTDVDLDKPQVDGLVGGRDLPVFGSALGGPDGEMIVSFEPIEWVRRPAPLEGVNGGFGFYMIGESMSPAYEPGDMILCHPTRPPYAGQDVLVIRRIGDGQGALVKRLVRLDTQGLRLRQFNPPGEFNVARDDVISFHLIVGKYSRR